MSVTILLPTTTKYDEIEQRGRTVLAAGAETLFTADIHLDWIRRLTGYLVPSLESRALLTPILGALIDATVSNGLVAWIADKDYTVHSTVMEGVFDGELPAETAEMHVRFENARRVPEIAQLRAMLCGVQVTFDRLLIAGNTMLAAATVIPENILRARATLAEAYASVGLRGLPMDNILHMSILRLRSRGGSADLQGFAEHLERLRSGWAPLTLSMQYFWFMQSSWILQP